MKKAILLILISSIAILSYCQETDEKPCGGQERWLVKIGSDPDASNVNTTFQNTSVESLTKLAVPCKIGRNTPRQTAERNCYTVLAVVKDYFKEADGDIHIVLQDVKDPSVTMIAEMPDFSCDQVSSSPYEAKFRRVRQDFLSVPKRKMVGTQHYFSGVLFFDIKHPKPQRGCAPNNAELHPILSFH